MTFDWPVVFPVRGHAEFASAYGKGHEGTDIFAPLRAEVVAVEDGKIRHADEPKGGLAVYLTTEDGTQYYYAHLDGFAPPILAAGKTRAVKAGEVIGYVGTTGNAAGKTPHIHFEMRPEGGEKKNPFEYLLSAPKTLGAKDTPVKKTDVPPEWPKPQPSAAAGVFGLLGFAWLWSRGRG